MYFSYHIPQSSLNMVYDRISYLPKLRVSTAFADADWACAKLVRLKNWSINFVGSITEHARLGSSYK